MKTLHGMTKTELQNYVARRQKQLISTDFNKYGAFSEIVKNYREKALQSLSNEVESYFDHE